jgi:GTP cyclohydrolase I
MVTRELEKSPELLQNLKDLLTAVGEDPERDGLQKTPYRFLKAFDFLTHGYAKDPNALINGALFDAPYSEMVIVKDIELYSVCEHHLLPFFGKCHVGYIPNGKVIGLSKIPRIVDAFARRLQVQERLTSQISECLMTHLKPQGVGVVIEASHLCMMMRGVEKQNAFAQTSSLQGVFQKQETRTEFFNLLKR